MRTAPGAYPCPQSSDSVRLTEVNRSRRLEVFGRCDCHEKSNVCTSESFGKKLICQNCSHGRIGDRCDQCPGFGSEKFPGEGPCPICKCNGHSEKCTIDSDGNPVCKNCKHGTIGNQVKISK